jgi:hypothetical protein
MRLPQASWLPLCLYRQYTRCLRRRRSSCKFSTSNQPTSPVSSSGGSLAGSHVYPSSTPTSVPATPPAIGRATYASALSSFPPAPSDNDDISVGYDFIGSDGSHNTTSEATTSYHAPCFVDEEQCPAPFIVPPPTPPSRGLLPSWLLRPLLFLICAYSTCHQSLNSNDPLLPTRRTVCQAVQY